MMQLPTLFQREFLGAIREFERENAMPYMNPFEKLGREEGRKEALCNLVEIQLAQRFGQLPQTVRERLAGADADDLQAWGKALLNAPSLEQVFVSR